MKINTVFIVSVLMCGGIGAWGVIDPDNMTGAAQALTGFALDSVDWFFLLLCTGFMLLGILLAASPYGRIKLGHDDDEPEFSTGSWIAMLFAGGMGAGLLFWGAAEPIYHYYSPPGMPGETADAARAAMVITNLHWGLHAWSIYAVCALVIAYFVFRKDSPSLISTPIRHAFGDVPGINAFANFSDILGVLAVIFGLAGSLSMGTLQVRAGLSEVFGVAPTTMVSIYILLLLAVCFFTSASTGVDKGIKILSNINMIVAIVLMLFILFVGPTRFIMETFITTIGDYFSNLIAMSFRLFPYNGLTDWTAGWTLTYLIWWLAWGPFVGIFIARISRGRTIREFIVGVVLIPTMFSMLWFATFGGSGFFIEFYGTGGIADLVFEDVTKALFALFTYFPLSDLLGVTALFLIFIFLVTSADSGTFVVSMMTSDGNLNPSTPFKLIWAVIITALTAATLFTGSIEVAKAMAITGAIPFSLILIIQIIGFLRTVREDHAPEDAPTKPPPGCGGGRMRAQGVTPKRRVGLAMLGLATFALAACGEGEQTLRVGSKDFTEALILGELIAQVAESQGIRVDREIPYGDTLDNIEALKRGDIDVYPEYNGTGLILLGQPPIADGDEATARVEELYDPLGLIWGARFGFANDYAILMHPDRAEEAGIRTISDLEKLDVFTIGIDDEFQQRPVDGFSPMLRRYGLDAEVAMVTDDTAQGKAELYGALLDGEVDVIEGFMTDGQIAEYNLVVLEDDLEFFPTYQASPLLRQAAMQTFPNLQGALNELGGQISNTTMQQMNADVELDGQDPAMVARRFLAEAGMIDADQQQLAVERLPVAVGHYDSPTGQIAIALAAVRKAFQGRDVALLQVADPLESLVSGQARLAVIDAAGFYELGEGVFPQPRAGAEAVGVVGFDLVHLMAASEGGPARLADVARLGVGAEDGASQRAAEMILTSLGLIDQVELVAIEPAEGDALGPEASALADGQIDAIFVMAGEGHPEIAELLAGGEVTLLGIPEWQEGNSLVRFPFLRVIRLAEDTYEGMTRPIETIGAQVVLAGPVPSSDAIGTAGPGSAAVGEILPLAETTIVELNGHLATGESLDPTIPSAAILRPQPKPAAEPINPSTANSITNLIVISVMIYLVYLYARPAPVRRRRESGQV